MKTIRYIVSGGSLAAALLVGACALGPNAYSMRTDSDFARVRQGMTQDEILALLGPPNETMPFAATRTHSLDYIAWDTFGYMIRFSVIVDDTGHVVSTVRARLNDGSNHQ